MVVDSTRSVYLGREERLRNLFKNLRYSPLEQIPDPIKQVSGDGAYDTRACYEAVLQRGATPTFVPRRTAKPSNTMDSTGWRAARNRVLQQIEAHGRLAWRV